MLKLVYHQLREEFGLTAHAAIRCIAKVADAYTTQKANARQGLVKFRKHAAQPYDDRILRFVAADTLSIWTLPGRMKIPFGAANVSVLCFAFAEAKST